MKYIYPAITVLLLFLTSSVLPAQRSVARIWNENLLDAISGDLARPTIHARNLFHVSVAMYDAWAVYSGTADTYFLGKTVHGYTCPYRSIPPVADKRAAQEEAISFAVYRLMLHRFANSPGKETVFPKINRLMDSLGYNRYKNSINYKAGPAEMGNYIADQLIKYGLQDGSNEAGAYANLYYKTVNAPFEPILFGNPTFTDLNRWQPLAFKDFVDQSGNPLGSFTPPFLSAEWGNVAPFSLKNEDAVTYQRDGNNYKVYHDPGPPALMDTTTGGGLSDEYKWNHALVAIWGSLLDPADGVMIDISPGAVGNNTSYPTDIPGLRSFYDLFEGGDPGTGRSINPKTGQSYTPQIVPRGDYTRVLAEFWADGPKSVTPPGHWFEILNYINDQPGLVRKIRGTGPLCDNLEWDVKAYFALGGAMHDAAIAAWSIKGWYDSARPISAIRGMAELGQSTDPNLPNYHPGGLPLIPGYIELIQPGDSLAGAAGEWVNEIKLKSWRGPTVIVKPETDVAGAGWVMAKYWWPYQRPEFVSPPFAGYVSGHSTYSRTAAELLTALTGDPYFPGGMGTFYCPRNQYLVFEDGPSADVVLQWATYRDASDQCSLSRIYGGIHPPMDDIPGRHIGIKLGPQALAFAEQYFTKTTPTDSTYTFRVFPNPTTSVVQIEMPFDGKMPVEIFAMDGRLVLTTTISFTGNQALLDMSGLGKGVYKVTGKNAAGDKVLEEKVLRI